jgi:hypothetical protein
MVMTRGRRLTCRAGLPLLALLAVAPALKPASAAAMLSPSGDRNLSPRLAKLARPAVRSAPDAAQADKLGLAAEGPGSLLRKGNGVLVYVRFERGAAAGLEALRAAGAKVVDVSRRQQTVTVAAEPAELASLAEAPNVAGVTEVLAPVAAAGTCPSGETVSEGLQQLHAGDGEGEARKEFAVDGSGVTVGVLSDSFDQATEAADGNSPVATKAPGDVAAGDLPGEGNPCGDTTPVTVLEDFASAESSDEGRAMAQIVHDLAPGADLDFASAFSGETAFANNIRELAAAGAKVIVDDVFYLEEPFFQDGPVAVAVNEVVAGGATYLSAAGNNNLIHSDGHDIASWEAPKYRDAGSCPQVVQALVEAHGTHCLDFNPGSQVDRTFGIKVEPGATLTVDLQWDEPWFGVGTDLDAFLLDSSGNLIAVSAEDNVKNSQKPLEIVEWTNRSKSERTVQLAINRFSGDSPRLKFALVENGAGVSATEYPRSTEEDVVGPTVFGHSGSAGAISVGAVPFNDSSEVEEYSSQGPVRHDFGPVKGVEVAAPVEPAETLSKPEIVATDCGLTTFFASFVGGSWRFCGTSAAAPHAAGVAALMLEAKPAATPAEIRAALLSSAVPVGVSGPCAVGAGLVEAVGAIEDLELPQAFAPPTCSPPSSEGSGEEAQAPGDWGSETPPAIPPTTPTQTPVTPAPAGEPSPVVAPRTFFRLRPTKLIRTRQLSAKVVFRFGSNEGDVSFACRIDGGPFQICPESLTRRFGIGRHTIRVVARDAAGNRDRTPAFYRFRVKRVR